MKVSYYLSKLRYPFFLLLITFICTLRPSHAKRFTNQYCEFELPLNWECSIEGTEYVCQSENKDRQKEAIIILAAKERGPNDSMAAYQTYLQKTKTFTLPGGRTQVSTPKFTKKQTLSDHVWIDSLHLASEVPGFYTRYLATVKADLGVAITFSVSKDHYNDYKDVFDKVVASLKVFRQIDNQAKDLVLKKKKENLLGPESTYIPPDSTLVDISDRQKSESMGSSSSTQSDLIFYLVLGAGIVGYIIYRRRNNKK